jgi:hypothetical protein
MTFSFLIFIRTIMATLGGYGVATCASLGMIPVSIWLFTDNPHDAVYISLMISYIVYFIAFIWCFSCKTAFASVRDLFSVAVIFLALFYLFPVELV